MTDQTDALAFRAEQTRNHLAELVDSLQNQITPRELVKQLVGGRSSNGDSNVGEIFTGIASRNPMACMLIAAGIGWLAMTEIADRNEKERRHRRARPRRKSPRSQMKKSS
jgi:Protein of unknown function (DUF3618)